MTVQIVLTFPDKAAAAAYLLGNTPAPTSNAQVSAPAQAPAPATNASTGSGFDFGALSQPSATGAEVAALDFNRDVVEPLKQVATKIPQQAFGQVMARIKATKVGDIEKMPDTWKPLVEFCKNPVKETFEAIPAK